MSKLFKKVAAWVDRLLARLVFEDDCCPMVRSEPAPTAKVEVGRSNRGRHWADDVEHTTEFARVPAESTP